MAIKTIALVHHEHTDFGYTDHPERTKLLHAAHLGEALNCIEASRDYPEGAKFTWTAEQTDTVRLWWQTADRKQKDRFLAAIKEGRMEVMGTAFNVTAFMDREEWEAAMNWLPEELWEACNIRSAMQIDVNGMHTQGMETAYDKGIRNLFIGPNYYYGMPPIPAPTAFNWKIAPDKELFVWLNSSYNNGYFIFNGNWRQGPVPNYSDLRYRKPEAGDIWASDEESVLQAHKLCLQSVAQLEGTVSDDEQAESDGFTKNRVFGGYPLEVLPVSVTSQWRVDNDPPFLPITDFVKKWNEMGLEPKLVLCTAGQAMEMVKAELGDNIPTYSGEWVDWWANGNASAPREMVYNREAKRTLKTAKLPVFGELTPAQEQEAQQIMENICMFDEHTFGSWQSVSNPYSYAPLSQTAEKNIYAYRALDRAQCLLAERVRALTDEVHNKIILWNPSQEAMSVFVDLPLNCMRGEYHSIRCEETDQVWPIEYVDGVANFLRPKDPSEFSRENVARTFSDKCEKQGIHFGPVSIPPMGKVVLVPMEAPSEGCAVAEKPVQIEVDSNNWPVMIQFQGQEPVLQGSFGELVSVEADGFSPRWTFKDIFENDNEQERIALRAEHLKEVEATYGRTECTQSVGMIQYVQEFCHPSLQYGKRILTVDLINGKLKLELRMDRRSNFDPEVIFLRFDAPNAVELPYISNAGKKFRPEHDQFPGSCMDFYAMDGWIHYPNGWLLNCVDNALVTFGHTSVVARKTTLGGPAGKVFVRLTDNIWDTNFAANPCGMMSFRFAAVADAAQDASAQKAEGISAEPVVCVKMGYRQ